MVGGLLDVPPGAKPAHVYDETVGTTGSVRAATRPPLQCCPAPFEPQQASSPAGVMTHV